MSEENNILKEVVENSSYETFEEYLATTDNNVRDLYNKHVNGLTSALEKERGSRKDLEKQMRDLLPKVEKGSVIEKELAEKVRLLEEADRKYLEVAKKAKFAEEANLPQIKCTNIKAAYALATVEDLFEDDGSPKWEDIKKIAPELFKTGGTDAGSISKREVQNDINVALRQAAFRR